MLYSVKIKVINATMGTTVPRQITFGLLAPLCPLEKQPIRSLDDDSSKHFVMYYIDPFI